MKSIFEPLVFETTNKCRFELSVSVLECMLEHIQDEADKPESGGVLLGRFILDSGDIVVDELTTPMDGDSQTRLSIRRGQKLHQKVIDNAWIESGGTCNYLGEWHTHPEPFPTPSSIDLDDWGRRLRIDFFDNESLFFVIVGTRDLVVWEGSKETFEIIPLSLCSDGGGRV